MKIIRVVLFILFATFTASAATPATGYLQIIRMPYEGDYVQIGELQPGCAAALQWTFTNNIFLTSSTCEQVMFYAGFTDIEYLTTSFAGFINVSSGISGITATKDPNVEGGIILTATVPGLAGNSLYLSGHATVSHCFRLTPFAGGSD